MKKIIITICLLSLVGTIRAEAFKVGENRASFGAGFGWKNKDIVKSYVNFPSPNALIERSILPFKNIGFISVGAKFGFHHGYHKEAEGKELRTEIYFVPRVALYFHEIFYEDDFPENIDLYGGAGFGFNLLSHRLSNGGEGSDSGFKPGYSFFIGGRYYFKKHVSVFTELGYGLSFLNVGMTIRY